MINPSDRMMSLQFPNDWPADCPPHDAVDAEGIVFRLVKNDPPQDKDVESHFESGRLPNAPPCLRCGLSVFRERTDADHQRRLLPNLGRWVAQATLQADHGRTKPTPTKIPTHTTWWPYEGVRRASLFIVVNGEG
jgi:hypothetical protein